MPLVSRLIFFSVSAASRMMRLPTVVDPVKAIMSVPRLCTRASPASGPVPVTMLTTPRGQQPRRPRPAPGWPSASVGRLDHHGVAGGQRGRDLPGHQQQRVVEGDDDPHHAEGLLHREVDLVLEPRGDGGAARGAPHLGVVVEAGGGPLDLVEVLDHRLAALDGHQLGQLVAALADDAGDLVQQARLVGAGQPAPGRLGPAGGGHRPLHVGRRRRAGRWRRSPRWRGSRPAWWRRCRRRPRPRRSTWTARSSCASFRLVRAPGLAGSRRRSLDARTYTKRTPLRR